MIPDEVTMIDHDAFNGANIQSVSLPHHLQNIGYRAFKSNRLEHVEFKGDIPATLGVSIFCQNNLTTSTIQVPKGTLTTYQKAMGWNHFQMNYLSPSKTWFGSDDDSLLSAFYE
ncbi:MAG: leucine-rich repeat protein [Bacilli bacterium]|nr:leucine-rich repeat protein [Bacilli bacterium]